MTTKRTTRAIAVIGAASLLVGALAAGPADAKKKKKKKKPPVCATYVPGDLGAEAETSVVTNEHTEEAPLEVTLSTGPGLGFTSTDPGGDTGETSHVYQNIQVDSSSPTAGLFVRVDYTPSWDYDIFLRSSDGASLAWEADFNPATAGGPTDLGSSEGAHPEPGAGQVDGFPASDCDGFTFDVASAITPGEDVVLTMWLGAPGG